MTDGSGRSPRQSTGTAGSYAELQVTTNFSFLNGGAHPEELIATAEALGLAAIAITDRNTLAGVVRAHLAARDRAIRLIVGCRLDLADAPGLLCYPTDRAAYARLSALLTRGKRRAPKGACYLSLADVAEHAAGQIFALIPPDRPDEAFGDEIARARVALMEGAAGAESLYLTAAHRYHGNDRRRFAVLARLAEAHGTPLLAVNDVLYHAPHRRALQDVVTCIREKCTIHTAGYRLNQNAERHLKGAAEMARLFRGHGEAVARTVAVAERCRFSLDELRYEYPDEITSPNRTPQEELHHLTMAGLARRYPDGAPERVRAAVAHELALIAKLGYAPYFLTVHDIVRFARSRGILCQGRGSAANSAVCYCLGITSVDPGKIELLFERFVSEARGEPPDIDVDFEHERREEVIQHIYERYGRDRAGLAATVICYRARGAIREVGKVMGLSEDVVDSLARSIWGWGSEAIEDERVREQGLDPADPVLRRTLDLTADLIGFPRHLSQHVGGFVISRGPLSDLCPILNAAMADRTTIEWDKDDLEALGLLKVDVLALGMLTCIRKAFDLTAAHHGRPLTLAGVPQDDAAVYEMLCRADSLGVFQVESRAQMSMLPRLKPRCFYDLVIEVAIVRPGPIQGDMVHPYLRRRGGLEAVEYPSEALESVLSKTLGVPLFQEQAMRIAIVAAGFSPSEADSLRRAMATFRKRGIIHAFEEKLIEGMVANGYERDFATRCFKQIEGFGTYGFPESHAASFALLVYVSAWLKCHYPDVFACALLNSQPMGFYAPAQIVRDAREHGVEVRPPDINHSDWDCTLESAAGPHCAVRLGLRQIKGLKAEAAERLVARRGTGYGSVAALWHRGDMSAAILERLARADGFRSIGLDRRAALWAVKRLGASPLPLFAGLAEEGNGAEDARPETSSVTLPTMPDSEHVVGDYVSLGLSLKHHPVAFLRDRLARRGVVACARLADLTHGMRAAVAGLVLVRQRPGSARGVVFVTVEDESGIANLVVLPPVFEQVRKALLGARLMVALGRVERQGRVIHLKVEGLEDATAMLGLLTDGTATGLKEGVTISGLARADEVRRPTADHRSLVEPFPRGRNFR